MVLLPASTPGTPRAPTLSLKKAPPRRFKHFVSQKCSMVLPTWPTCNQQTLYSPTTKVHLRMQEMALSLQGQSLSNSHLPLVAKRNLWSLRLQDRQLRALSKLGAVPMHQVPHLWTQICRHWPRRSVRGSWLVSRSRSSLKFQSKMSHSALFTSRSTMWWVQEAPSLWRTKNGFASSRQAPPLS